jgi:hypothetical protein
MDGLSDAVDLPIIAPGVRYNRGAGIRIAMEIGAGIAGQFDMIHGELVDTRATKPDAVIWGHNYGIVVNENCERFYDEGEDYLFASFELIAYDTWRYQNRQFSPVSFLACAKHSSIRTAPRGPGQVEQRGARAHRTVEPAPPDPIVGSSTTTSAQPRSKWR